MIRGTYSPTDVLMQWLGLIQNCVDATTAIAHHTFLRQRSMKLPGTAGIAPKMRLLAMTKWRLLIVIVVDICRLAYRLV